MTSPYVNRLVNSQESVDFRKAAGKTVVLTGGSSGLGLAYMQALIAAGAFVVNGDINPPSVAIPSDKGVFVKCDVSSWHEQVNVFRRAKEKSPNGNIDVVIANAGIYGPDTLDGLSDEEPTKPNTAILNVNLVGVIYTTRLAAWSFKKQGTLDPCIILITSIMGYIDTQGSSLYSAAKHGVRGLMTCLRRKQAIRVNCIAPWFIATPILKDSFVESTRRQFEAKGVDFALAEDAVSAVFRLVTDTSINGRTLGIVPRQLSSSGYMDLNHDDYNESDPLYNLQIVASTLVYDGVA
ncbi:hypothetical protein BGW36DRAFT_429489 [Talaromyces proteolyticus]|uniref:Uncharacterized protein n=1 Tax=Talaromyces proteolyticus TaxID=1131652 RepID=A0AAD4PWY8_9EURO|nr:uncharacterized protein BGW36DRAFT_429489 [Talaromyces proteolyticus]KAH8695620.1 hypothetical protein BGW36DRAFT_429489 [Talaromyces proteolyticus]